MRRPKAVSRGVRKSVPTADEIEIDLLEFQRLLLARKLVSPENVSSVVNIAASMVHTRQATPFLPDTSEPNSLTALADVNFAIHQDKQWKAAALIAFCAHDSPEWRRVIRAWMLAVPTTRASCGVDTT